MKNKTIFIVDDNELNIKLAVDLLELAGFNVLKAFDGPAALAMLKVQKPDLILLDIGLPGMNGYEVYQNIRSNENLKSVKIVAFTASVMKHEKEQMLKIGFNALIQKPINATNFAQEVGALLQ